jgi:hypothetical protein
MRFDPQAKHDAIHPVQRKVGDAVGHYLNPEAYGRPVSDGGNRLELKGSAHKATMASGRKLASER